MCVKNIGEKKTETNMYLEQPLYFTHKYLKLARGTQTEL